MDDFVAEIRPRSFPSQRYSAANQQDVDDMITQIKSKSRDQINFKQNGYQGYPEETSDLYVQKRLADLHISRDKLTNLLERSILTLVEKLMTGQSISKIEGTLCIFCDSESPIIVDLQKIFPRPHSKCSADHALDTCLNVKIKDKDITDVCPPCEKSVTPCSPSDRDVCQSPADGSPRVSSECHMYNFPPTPQQDITFLSPPPSNHSLSPTPECHLSSPTPENTLSSFSPSPHSQVFNPKVEVTKQMHISGPDNKRDKQMTQDNGDVCASATSDKEETDIFQETCKNDIKKYISLFTDYFCNGFDGENMPDVQAVSPDSGVSITLDSCGSSEEGSDEMDEEDDVECDRLVIDEDSVNNLQTTDTGKMFSSLVDENIDGKEILTNKIDYHKNNSNVSPHHDNKDEKENIIEGVDSTVSSDSTDSEIHLELPGNSKSSLDVELVVPHPQSIMTKLPGGFQCKQCLDVLPDKSQVSAHVQSKHNLYCCTYCCRTFTAKNNLKRHVRRHTGQKPYKCTHCPKAFFRRDDMKGHMTRHDYTKPFRCGLCKKGYTDRSCVKNHMAKEHGSRVTHICPQCGESFNRDESFTTHKKSHPELQQFSCKTCSFIGTNNLMTLKHGLVHSHKLFSCKPCNAYFADPFQYTSHVRKHKKTGSFSQYVCCFCNMVLATYDQFVRHEYIHAQIKTHTCRICNKQFRSRYLLQDHAVSHQEVAVAEVNCLRHMRTDDAHNYVIVKEAQFNPNIIIGGNEMSKLDSADRPVRQTTEPGSEQRRKVQNTDNYEFYGELLDLSMKKSPIASFNSDSIDDQGKVGESLASLRTTGLQEYNFPRNGEVSSQPVNLSQKREVTLQSSAGRQSLNAEMGSENINKPVFKINDSQITLDQHRRVERDGVCQADVGLDHRPCHQNNLKSAYRSPPLRFSPYSREKMAELAVKFMAARGVKEAGNGGPLQALIPVGEDRRALVITEQNIQRKHPSFLMLPLSKDTHVLKDNERQDVGQAIDDNDEVVSEYSNPEMALRCHIPSFIKSEPGLGQEENCHNKAEHKNSRARVLNGGNHGCDLCTDKFSSFHELEDHSVEVHKRYLCEHCRKSFTARPNRDRHVRYHTGERPYRCDLCDLAFFRGDDLKYHRTTRHPSAQPFVCTHCSASFTWGRDLERHVRHSKCKM